MRLDQFLVKSNICSRSEAKKYVKKGRVSVDGQIVSDSSAHIDEKSARVAVDGVLIEYEANHYYMLNKPAGCVSATKDGLSDTVIDMLCGEPVNGLFPVGRLDKDTEGLLLITDDGKLAHELLSPKKHVDKCYYVLSNARLSSEDMVRMREGIDIGDDKPTLPADICESERIINIPADIDNGNGSFSYELTIHEGRFHQVKRMFEACGAKVIYLKRLTMGPLKLDESLETGKYRKLTENEIQMLKTR